MINDGKVIVSLFAPKTLRETVLTTNGRILDGYCTSLKGTPDLSGNFRLTGNFLNKNELYKYLNEGCILKVRDEFGEDEIFRITTVTPSPFLISVIAFQITITDTQSLWLDDVRPTNQNGLSALQWLYENADSMGFKKEITMHSDIDTVNTAYYQNMNLHNALFNCDQSFINRWGGEVKRHQYELTINKQIGEDNNVTIREDKNLTGFEATISEDDLCTIAVGQGFNGIKGHYIESPLKDKYERAFTKVIEYSDVKVKTDSDDTKDDETILLFDTLEEAQAELDKRIKKEFSENHVDEIKATYNIDFVELSKTEKFKDYVKAEKLHIGDYANVIVNSLDIRIKVRVFNKEIDYLVGRVNKMTLSNVSTASLETSDSKIVANIRKLLNKNNTLDLGQYVDTKIKEGMKNSHVLVRKNEVLIMDSNDVDDAESIWRWNKNGLGFSSDGYDGKYTIGLTSDGALNANIIKTGVLSTVLIQNADGSFKIDLSGRGGADFYNNGQLAMRMQNNALKLFDWGNNSNEMIGGLTSLLKNDDNEKPIPSMPLVSLLHEKNAAVTIDYRTEGNKSKSYVEFDKYNILKSKNTAPIRVNENVEMADNNIYNAHFKANKATPFYINNKEVMLLNEDKIFFYVPVYNSKGKLVLDPNAPQGDIYPDDDNKKLIDKLIKVAKSELGKPYVYGATGPNSFDCSGLMQYCFKQVGISIGRTTYDQVREGQAVSKADLQVGDLVFPSADHVGLYIGNNQILHAPHTGDVVKISTIWTFYKARRIIKSYPHKTPITPSHGGGGSTTGIAGDKASRSLIMFTKQQEGFASEIYNDGGGQGGTDTLGYGLTGNELETAKASGLPLSEASATHYLVMYFNRDYYVPTLKLIKSKGITPLQMEVDSLADFCYNEGYGSLSTSHLLIEYVNYVKGGRKDSSQVHYQFMRWTTSNGEFMQGLKNRREAEFKILIGAGSTVQGYGTKPSIEDITHGGVVTANGGYGAEPY